MYVYICLHLYIPMYTRIYIPIYTHPHTHTYIHLRICIYIRIYTHPHTHTHFHLRTHTHTPRFHCKCTNRCLPVIPLPPLSPTPSTVSLRETYTLTGTGEGFFGVMSKDMAQEYEKMRRFNRSSRDAGDVAFWNFGETCRKKWCMNTKDVTFPSQFARGA